jgi:hypothetical protein
VAFLFLWAALLTLSAPAPAAAPSDECELPYARTGFAEALSGTEAVLYGGFVNARGSTTTAQFEIGPTEAYGRLFPRIPEHFYVGWRHSELEQGVDGLRPGTTYHVRLAATNECGVTYGRDETFKTQPRQLRRPTILDTHAYGVDDWSAVIIGRIDPHGSPTVWHFQLGTTKSYGLHLAGTSLENPLRGDGREVVEEAVNCLAPETTFHFRLVATNSAGRTFGPDRTFTTKRATAPAAAVYRTCPEGKPAAARVPAGLSCPGHFSAVWEFAATEHTPLVPTAGLRGAVICRYAGASPLNPSPGRLLGRRALGRRDATSIAREIDGLPPERPGSGRSFAGPLRFQAPGAFLEFSYGPSRILRLTAYFTGRPQLTSGTGRQSFVATPKLVRRLHQLTPTR